MKLDREQRRIARKIIRVGKRMGAPPKVLKAALEAGLVESNLRNVNYGDRDSLGVFQQRPSQGWGTPQQVRRPKYAARQFYKRAIPLADKYGSAGQLAQAVQRSAFPERYDQRAADAERILRRIGAGGRGQAPRGTRPGLLPVGLPGYEAQIASTRRPPVPSSNPDLPEFAARALMPAGYAPPMPSAMPSREPEPDLLAAVAASILPGAPDALKSTRQRGGGKAQAGRLKGTPKRLAVGVDRWAQDLGVPITAKEEPGHAPGGDHDPAVRGATARDYGGSEKQRRALFRRVTRALGIKNAVYKGKDINVTRNGVRWQIISRDHGTGPHLHIGWRRVSRAR